MSPHHPLFARGRRSFVAFRSLGQVGRRRPVRRYNPRLYRPVPLFVWG